MPRTKSGDTPFNDGKDKGILSKDRRVSVCTFCKKGIFEGQEYNWVRGYGLCHTGCGDELT